MRNRKQRKNTKVKKGNKVMANEVIDPNKVDSLIKHTHTTNNRIDCNDREYLSHTSK